jgi:hypothetical protein
MSVLELNGEIQRMELPTGILISDIVARHLAEHIPDGQVISEVHVDGRVVEIDRTCWGEFEKLSISTCDPESMVVRGLQASGERMEKICSNLRHATEHLRLGNESHFRPLFVSAIDELLTFLQFLALSRSYLGDKGSALDQFQIQIKEQVEQMFQAQKRRDLVLLADLIEYELTPLFEGWQGVRNALLKSLSQKECNA